MLRIELISPENSDNEGAFNARAITVDGSGYICAHGLVMSDCGEEFVIREVWARTSRSLIYPDLPSEGPNYVKGEFVADEFFFYGPQNSDDGYNHLLPVLRPSSSEQSYYCYIWVLIDDPRAPYWVQYERYDYLPRHFRFVGKKTTDCQDTPW